MIKEHGDLILDINEFLTDIGNHGKYTTKYLHDEFYAIEIYLLGWSFTTEAEEWMREYFSDKFNHIVKEIYTIEKGSLYIMYLNPIEQIRTNKINKLQNKITNGI